MTAPGPGEPSANVVIGIPRPGGGRTWISASSRRLATPGTDVPGALFIFEEIGNRPPDREP